MIRVVDRATINVYEEHAREWRARRKVRGTDRALSLGRAGVDGKPRIDLGCGVGFHLPHLGVPVVGIDGARAMLDLAREAAPDAWLLQGDLEALPFRDRSLGVAWARKSYLHVPRARLPMAIADLHRALVVGAPAELMLRHGTGEGLLTSDDFPGRFFAEWEPEQLVDVITGGGFDIVECSIETDDRECVRVAAIRARTLPDVVGPGMRVLLCGLNPSLYAADVGVGFARPGNRFWPAAIAAGLVSRERDPRHALTHHGVGMTDLVKRATTGAAELTRADYIEGVARVERLVRRLRPRVVCFVGLAGWRAAVDRNAAAGEQPDGLGGARAYVMPNTSGINAHARLEDLVAHLRAAAALS
jgi:TDG/mug DNA glycosylase family protein